MPIELDKCTGFEFAKGEASYREDDVILYNLGVGAGDPPTSPSELAYTYEKHLKALPSFAGVTATGAKVDIFNIPGVKFKPTSIVHGEQEVILHKPLPPRAKLRGSGRVVGVYDKGKGALLVFDTDAHDAESGDPLFTRRTSLFLRGEGGFGGADGPAVGNEPPERAPDGVIETKTLPQQALLYRLCGDKSPLHCDPEFAAKAGFERPILHGLCSYGIVCKAVIDGALGGDVAQVAGYQARFAGMAYPGETFVTAYWRQGERLIIAAKSKERGAAILSNAAISLRK